MPDMPDNRARAKLDWAREHIHKFEGEFIPFLNSNPYTIWRKGHRYRFEIKDQPKNEWGLIIGDAVHNMRSAMDHLVWQLSRQVVDNPSRDIDFPIFATKPTGDALRKRIKHLPPEARKVIRSLQPYNRPDKAGDHKLYLLSALDNADKHRSLSIVAYGFVLTVQAHDKVFSQTFWGGLDDGDEFSIERISILGTGDLSKVKVATKVDPVIGIAFDDLGVARNVEIYPKNNLASLFQYVDRRVFKPLEPFLKSISSTGKR